MIPQTLEGWTIPIIVDLLTKGYYETEFWDFKQMLPHKKNADEKERLIKSCCAFANSGGGFLIFGVKDDKTLPPDQRLVGFDPAFDFPQQFGVYPTKCTPTVNW